MVFSKNLYVMNIEIGKIYRLTVYGWKLVMPSTLFGSFANLVT